MHKTFGLVTQTMVRVPKMRYRGFFFFLGPLTFCSGPIM